jgi:hypothetical protein
MKNQTTKPRAAKRPARSFGTTLKRVKKKLTRDQFERLFELLEAFRIIHETHIAAQHRLTRFIEELAQ